MAEWIDVGVIDDIPAQGSRLVETARGPVALFRTADDQVFALYNRCPHRQGPLSEGIVHGHRVTCPLHSWVIDLESGQAMAPDVGCAPAVPVRIDSGRIFLAVPAALKVVHG